MTEEEKAAIKYFNLEYAESEEEGAGWFAYTKFFGLRPGYPGTSCESLSDVVEWYRQAKGSGSEELPEGE